MRSNFPSGATILSRFPGSLSQPSQPAQDLVSPKGAKARCWWRFSTALSTGNSEFTCSSIDFSTLVKSFVCKVSRFSTGAPVWMQLYRNTKNKILNSRLSGFWKTVALLWRHYYLRFMNAMRSWKFEARELISSNTCRGTENRKGEFGHMTHVQRTFWSCCPGSFPPPPPPLTLLAPRCFSFLSRLFSLGLLHSD